MTDRIRVARIGAPHGVRGQVRVKPFTVDPLALGDYGPLQADDGRSFVVTELRPAKNVVVARLEGVTTREQAEALNGTDLFIDRSALPDDTDEDEFYAADLIGMAAQTEDGTAVGTIIAVPDFGAGDLLEIRPASAGETWYLPFTRETVPTINLANRTLTVVIPDEVSERDA